MLILHFFVYCNFSILFLSVLAKCSAGNRSLVKTCNLCFHKLLNYFLIVLPFLEFLKIIDLMDLKINLYNKE